MKKLKLYVGLDGKYVFCERFPNDEEHAGLHEMLGEFIDNVPDLDYNDGVAPQGFYLADFTIVVHDLHNSPEYHAMLDIRELMPITDNKVSCGHI